MQSVILLSFVASSTLPSCGLQSAHLPMPCYIRPYVVYNVYGIADKIIKSAPNNRNFSHGICGNPTQKPPHAKFETLIPAQ